MAENKVGRPTVMTKEVLSKLEMLFAHGLTDREACLIADINPATLYNYCNENPEFSDKLFDKYTARMANVYALLPCELGKIRNVYD